MGFVGSFHCCFTAVISFDPPPLMLLQWWKHAASTWKATFKIDNYVGAALEW